MSAYNSLGPVGSLRVSGPSEVIELYLLFITIVITTYHSDWFPDPRLLYGETIGAHPSIIRIPV